MWPQYVVLALVTFRFAWGLIDLGSKWASDKNKAIGFFIANIVWNAGILFVLDAGGFFDNL